MKTNKLTILTLEKQIITRLHSHTITAGNSPILESDKCFTGGVENSCYSSYC